MEKRFAEVKARKLCVNCSKFDHSTFRCSRPLCRFCHKKHNNLLHVAGTVNNALSPQPVTVPQNIVSESPQMPIEPVNSTKMCSFLKRQILFRSSKFSGLSRITFTRNSLPTSHKFFADGVLLSPLRSSFTIIFLCKRLDRCAVAVNASQNLSL